MDVARRDKAGMIILGKRRLRRIAQPMTGMRAIPAVPDDRPMSPFIADAVEKLPREPRQSKN